MFLTIHLFHPSPIIDPLIPNVMAGFEHIPRITVLEKGIHLLQASARGFRIHEDDEGDAEDVEPEEEEEGAVADGLEEEGGDHGDDAIADGPADNGPGATLCAHIQWEDFGWVKPRGCEPGSTEGCGIQEGESGDAGPKRALAGSIDLSVLIEDAGNQEFNGHGDSAPYHGR